MLDGVSVTWQPGLATYRGKLEIVVTVQGALVRGPGPTQPQLGVKVSVSVDSTVSGLLNRVSVGISLVMVVTNGKHILVRVGLAPGPGTAVTLSHDGSGSARVSVVDPEGPMKLVEIGAQPRAGCKVTTPVKKEVSND